MSNRRLFALGGAAIVLAVLTVLVTVVNHASSRKSAFYSYRDAANQRPYGDEYRGMGERNHGMMGNRHGKSSARSGQEGCIADECLLVDGLEYPVATLSDSAKAALGAALDDEYKAFATYQPVIEEFGAVRPFIMISRAEEQHIAALKALYDKYGIAVPENSYLGTISAPESVLAACQTGVDAETANAALYDDRLLPAVSTYPDIVRVFTNLRNASANRHLPAFERCRG